MILDTGYWIGKKWRLIVIDGDLGLGKKLDIQNRYWIIIWNLIIGFWNLETGTLNFKQNTLKR